MIPRLSLRVLGLILAVTTTLSAHEFWLTAQPWRITPGQRAAILVNVGSRFPLASTFTAPERIESIRLFGPAGEIPIRPPFSREKDSLAATVKPPAIPGTYVGVVTVKPRFLEIKAPSFEMYLKHEGLDSVIAARARAGEASAPGRERYSRYGKTLIRVGDAAPGAHVSRPLGLPVELVPLTDPASLKPGDRCRVRLLFQGEPVVGAMVGAIYASAKVQPDEWPLTERTDAHGEVQFTLTDPGPWLIRTVHMVRRGGESGAEAADWESYWASLSFALDGGVPSSRERD